MANKKNVIFIASSGGHLTQLLQLQPIFNEFNSFIITEKDITTNELSERVGDSAKIFYIPETRKRSKGQYLKGNIGTLLKSIKYYFQIKPDAVISTGAGISVYLNYIAKLFGKKIIFIETYAAIKGKSQAGKLIYPIADKFYIQWKSLQRIYPHGLYKGTLY